MAENGIEILLEPLQLLEILTREPKDDRNCFLFDCSWLNLPIFKGRDAATEFANLRIPGAVFFDIDKCSCPGDLPHMLLPPTEFSEYLTKLCHRDISGYLSSSLPRVVKDIDLKRDTFIVYDSLGTWSAPRVWFMLRYYGATSVHVLNGGLGRWIQKHLPIDTSMHNAADDLTESQHSSSVDLKGISLSRNMVKAIADVHAIVTTQSALIVDARPEGRFLGQDAEPRPGLPSGHIPGSVNVPWTAILKKHSYKRPRLTCSGQLLQEETEEVDCDYYMYRHREEIKHIYSEKCNGQFNCSPQLVFSCGSGISGALLLLGAIYSCVRSFEDVALYDGSWTEWKLDDMKRQLLDEQNRGVDGLETL